MHGVWVERDRTGVRESSKNVSIVIQRDDNGLKGTKAVAVEIERKDSFERCLEDLMIKCRDERSGKISNNSEVLNLGKWVDRCLCH